MGTYSAKARRGRVQWQLVDAEGKVLGRLAARAAKILTGKTRPDFSPHMDSRHGVIVVNAAKVVLTGRKLEAKAYRHYTGYPGGLKEISARDYLATKPDRLLRDAIVGMLPKTRLGERMASRLKIYAGPTHPHQAQKPEPLSWD